MRKFAQAAVVAAAMSVPVFAGAMIAPQAHANHCVSGVLPITGGGTEAFTSCPPTQTPQQANALKDVIREAGGTASGSPTTFPGPPSVLPPGVSKKHS